MLAYNLKKLMLNHGISSKKLADIISVNRSTLIKILNGSTLAPRVETIYALANYFNISVNKLLGEDAECLNKLEDTTLLNNIREQLIHLMKIHDIKTAAELNKLSNISYSVIEDILLGKTNTPHISTLEKLATFFNISVSQVLGFDSSPAILTAHDDKDKIPVFDITALHEFTIGNAHPIKYIESFRKSSIKNAFSLLITIDDLVPDFYKGDLLIISPAEIPRPNDFIVAKINSNVWIFECITINSEFMYLKNAGKFDAKKIEIQKIKILGIIIHKITNEFS